MSIPTVLLERTEVVKGPNSLLYGPFSGAGGYVNMITMKPLDDFRGEVSASIGTDGYYRGMFDITGPIEAFDGTVDYRVIGEMTDGDFPGYDGSFDESMTLHG